MKRVWDFVSPFLVYYVVFTIVGNVFHKSVYEYPTEISTVAALLTIPCLIIMVYRDKKKEGGAGVFWSKNLPLSKYGLIIGVSVTAAIALNNILLFLNMDAYSETYQETAASLYEPAFWMLIIYAGIVFPVMEEYLFRGLLYRRMRSDVSETWAILLSSLFFGIYHGNIVQAVYGMAAGALFACLYETYGSMKAPILSHMIMNITSCVLTAAGGFTWMLSSALRTGVITAVCTAIGIVMLRRISALKAGTE